MEASGEGSRTSTLPRCPTLRLRSRGTDASNENMLQGQNLFKQDVVQATGEVLRCRSQQQVLTHSLHHIQHVPSDSPVRFMVHCEAAAAFVSLHTDNTVCLYKADGSKQTPSVRLPFMGLTPTKITSRFVGWGPGAVLTLLDKEFNPVDTAHDALDICVCQPAEHSAELVTAGAGNVCVWSVRLVRCKVKIQEGLERHAFTHMVLAPPRSDRPHTAFAACGRAVAVVDLDEGKLLGCRKDLCSGDISAMVYCSQLDCLITASNELSIRVWGPDWELRRAFVGHTGTVTSLFYCAELNVLLSASVDCTIRWWNVEKGTVARCVSAERPSLCVGGTREGDIFFSVSQHGVDFWSIRNPYSLHCRLQREDGAPLRQILVPPVRAPYPARVLCVSGGGDVALVSAKTGAVVTSLKAQQRILCADYCLHREILLLLTDAGDVLRGNALTNPVTLMQAWRGRGQGPWQQGECVTKDGAQHLPAPGPACCLVLYSYVTEPQGALEEWRSLQDRRGCSHRDKAADDAKNRFLIILGQNGGCVSVLNLGDGKVLCRTPAHGGQRVTSVQVYPEAGCLLSTGKDKTLVVWRVTPFVQECLSQQLSLQCGQAQVYAAALGPQLALTFQEQNTGIYSLMHFDLLSQSQADQSLREGHLDHCTGFPAGLCACPDLEVFVSSSLDGTVCIWDKDNHLIRILQLDATPEHLAYGGSGGELFLGIAGDLYRMNCAQFLPHKYQQMLLYTYYEEPLPDLPIIESEAQGSKRKTYQATERREAESSAITRDQSLTDVRRQQEHESTASLNSDLCSLLRGTVKRKKAKPPSTKQTRKEAFDGYMKILYGWSYDVQIDMDYKLDPEILSSDVTKPCNLPPPEEDAYPEPEVSDPLNAEKEKNKKALQASWRPKTLMDVKPWPVRTTVQHEPAAVEKEDELPEMASPEKQPEPPQTPRGIETLTAPPPREPSPQVPAFLQQFADAAWFRDMYPDKKSIPSILTPDEFSLKLLACLKTCGAASRVKVLAALQALHSQDLLKNTDKLYQGLVGLVPKCATTHMSPLDQTVIVEMLNLLLGLKSAQSDLVKLLLTLLAYKDLGLQETLLHMLAALGVDEAEQWLWPELQDWSSELQHQPEMWTSLRDRADSWLEQWISTYKEYNRHMYLTSTAKWKPLTFSTVDVLNYFCSVQREECRKARYAGPDGQDNTVLLPRYDCSQPILRLGETYSMARVRRPPGIILPPLRNRPVLMDFPNFISLPMTRVTLRPFHVYSDKDWLKDLPRRYFVPHQSFVEYYR
ncbi:WD repeat-containing protein 97 isoform X2 [Betta splendens]|uniref:WD repeat-containing protein 97 isoform X2 n=1 Tax=Betta splendens TaxID=158456 RepID=A0A6P7M5X1_BETSP|nr:WD repeat-containing protein 97 isoform X2 [Betta splendens]